MQSEKKKKEEQEQEQEGIKAEIDEMENRKSIEKKNNKTKRWFFEKVNKIDQLLARLSKEKKRHKLLI